MIEKVTAFITRPGQNGRELLVFQHPNAGIQLPAGTVEPGEDVETAVLREAFEETGLKQLTIARQLAIIENELQPGQISNTRPVQALWQPAATALPFAHLFSRGMTLTATGQHQNGYTQVTYQEYDQYPHPTAITLHIAGWLPDAIITRHKRRTLLALTCHEATPPRWSLTSDGDRIFAPFWTPLAPKPELVGGQNAWLDLVYAQLTA